MGGSPRDVEFDFLETLMSDGHYPEHFFNEEAQVMPMQEHADKTSMLLQKRDELKDDCDDAICETEGRAKRNILMNGKAIATKEKAFSKVLKFAKAAVAKALKATQALVLTEKLKVKITPKMMVRNAVYLKAFAVLNADKLDYSSKRLGILGTLLTLLMVKSKKSPVAQYADSIKMLAETNKKGLPRYMLRAIATSMMGDGVVSMGPVRHKVGQYVKISMGTHSIRRNEASVSGLVHGMGNSALMRQGLLQLGCDICKLKLASYLHSIIVLVYDRIVGSPLLGFYYEPAPGACY